MPTGPKFEAVVLERGISHEPEFVNRANSINDPPAEFGTDGPPRDSRSDVIIEVLTEAGQLRRSGVGPHDGLFPQRPVDGF